jgi:hypothetical protein
LTPSFQKGEFGMADKESEIVYGVAADTTVEDLDEVAEGLDTLDCATDVAAAVTDEAMAGAADITRAVDAEVVAGRSID